MVEADAARTMCIKDLKVCGAWASATTTSDAATARPAPVGASLAFMVNGFAFCGSVDGFGAVSERVAKPSLSGVNSGVRPPNSNLGDFNCHAAGPTWAARGAGIPGRAARGSTKSKGNLRSVSPIQIMPFKVANPRLCSRGEPQRRA
jgi:hypothetical protein